MTSINVTVCEAQAQAVKNGKLTTHMVGVPVSFSFDAAWDGLHKFAVFRCGKVTRDRSLILSDTTTVPHEVLHKAEEHLFVGVEGRAPDGTLVIPTTWADAGVVLDGANACGVRGKDPTPDAYDDIMEAIQSGILRGPKGDKGDPGASYIRDIGAGRLNEAEKAALATVDGEGFLTDPIFMESNNLDGFSRWVYKQIGVDVGAYMKSVHKTYTSMFNYRLLTVEEGADPYCLAMLVDGSYSGKTTWMQNNGYEYKLELKDYKIGDIFCMRYNDTLEGLSGTRTSCYYMALYQAENTFILYQDFGAEEEKLYPSNVKVIDYAALLDIINTTENQYYYVLRPENIALMPVMEAEQRQAKENEALSNRIDALSGRLRDMNIGKLTESEKSAIANLTATGKVGTQLTSIAVWSYSKAGIDVSAYFTGETVNKVNQILNGTVVGNSSYFTMFVPGSRQPLNQFQIGDIFCGRYSDNGANRYWSAVYQGNNQFIKNENSVSNAEIVTFDETNTIYTGKDWVYYYALRPERIAIEDVIYSEQGLLPYPDNTLSVPGKAADAAAVGAALNAKAPAGLVSADYYASSITAFEGAIEEVYTKMLNGTEKIVQIDLTSGNNTVYSGSWFVTIDKRSANIGQLRMAQPESQIVQQRHRNNGTWGQWEYVNPAMFPAVEYRTTERWNGKPVYAWLIGAEALPNTDFKTVYFSDNPNTVDNVVYCEGSTNEGMRLPYVIADTSKCVYLNSGKGYVDITTGIDRSNTTATILVKYTKTTD